MLSDKITPDYQYLPGFQKNEPKEKFISPINWNFPKSVPSALDCIHPYPAKFIKDIPKTLLYKFNPPITSWIYDPFCGSGTTLVAAQELGYKTLGVDLNPIACLISRVKTSKQNQSNFNLHVFLKNAKSFRGGSENVHIKNINHWFQPHIIREILSIKNAISKVKNVYLRNILNLSLSRIIVRISNQESDTRYAAIDKELPKGISYELFKESYHNIVNALNSRAYKLYKSKVFCNNILDFNNKYFYNKIGAVITSPPYPNAYEYWLYHKFRMLWLGYDPQIVKQLEIGARYKYYGTYGESENDFYHQMESLFRNLFNLIISGGFIGFIIGRSIIHGKYIENYKMIIRAAEKNNFSLIDIIERDINSSKKSFNLAHAKITNEKILILQK